MARQQPAPVQPLKPHLQARLRRIEALAREGKTVAEIATVVGGSRSNVIWLMRASATSIGVLRGVRCSYCGDVIQRAKRKPTILGLHACRKPACRRRLQNALTRDEQRRARERRESR